MKNIGMVLLSFLITIGAMSQSPRAFNYQGVIRNSSGEVLANQQVTFRFSLTNNDASTVYYSESRISATNGLGIVNVPIGLGDIIQGNFSEIPWESGDIYLKVEIMPEGSAGFTDMGIQRLLSVPYALFASDGISMKWLGSLPNPPAFPSRNEAYYNTMNKASFIWDGDSWEILALDGLPGIQGAQGDQGPAGPKGEPGEPGLDGISLIWLGSFDNEPIAPTLNNAYYNTTTKKSYIWDGDSWEIIAQDGEVGPVGPQGPQGLQGPQGQPGSNGISLIWLGTLADAPSNPSINQAYYNSTEKKSYVYNGVGWDIIAQDGAIGPQGPQGEQGPQGDPGVNGISVQWLGSLASAPGSPQLNQAYYNTTSKISYIWDGDTWE
ncbi:MAG TPA: hypothetical protein PLW22_02660, partial [Tenuifilum sp.]|nr:hypothetical protein [Tenuifilum sp.]